MSWRKRPRRAARFGEPDPWALHYALQIVLAGGIIAVGAFALAYRWVDGTDKDRVDVGISIAATVAAATAGILTWGRLELSRREHRLALDRDLTERYGRAITQLGDRYSPPLVRAGGAFALERFALDAFALSGVNNDTDWRMALDLLADFVRVRQTQPPAGSSGNEQTPAPATDQVASDPSSAVLEGRWTAFFRSLSRRWEARLGGAEADDSPIAAVPVDVLAALRALGRFSTRSRAAGVIRYDLHGIDLGGADLHGYMLIGADLSHANLARCDLTGAKLVDARLTYADLTEANLEEADLTNANLTGAKLARARLISAHLKRAVLAGGADLTKANLTGAQLRYVEFSYADLTKAELAGADLTGAKLVNARLSRANLKSAHLTHAYLTRAYVDDANFRRAHLNNAHFNNADLTGANLTEVDLIGANLIGATLTGADLAGVLYDETTRWPARFTPPPSRSR